MNRKLFALVAILAVAMLGILCLTTTANDTASLAVAIQAQAFQTNEANEAATMTVDLRALQVMANEMKSNRTTASACSAKTADLDARGDRLICPANFAGNSLVSLSDLKASARLGGRLICPLSALTSKDGELTALRCRLICHVARLLRC
jgi:hypothetical protein